jgi:saccharopine dehydrogenase (NAD+, L-glutamate forming)
MADRAHDIVLFGATGFTGGLTAQYLADHAGGDTRWAIAGRNRRKLEDVRRRLGEGHAELPFIEADANDAASMRRLAESTRVVITTVGPYIHYGEPLVAACAAAGTDYVDLTGEPEFVDLMWLRYNEEAKASGARIVHSCGFDSIPYDLGALFTVERLPEGVPLKLEGFVRGGVQPSGGTFHSLVHILARLREGRKVAGERRAQEARLARAEESRPTDATESRPANRRVRGVSGMPHDDPAAGGWVVPFPTIDPLTVLRSARALDRYGPDFSYSHYLVVRNLPMAIGFGVGAAALIGLAQLPPTRDLLLKWKDPGEGPSPEQREKGWFKVRMVGDGGGERVVTEVSGGDPGYDESSKMLAESALCLAHDELPETAGQLTPAVAMGDALIARLQRAGIRFETLESR